MLKLVSSFEERLGLNAYVQGDYLKALKWFRRLEGSEPDSIRVLRNLGVILLASGDAAGAKSYLLREEKLYGPSYHRHSALADLAYAVGDRKEAARRYALALEEPEASVGGATGPDGAAAAMRPLLETRLALCRDESAFRRSREAMGRFKAGEGARDSGDARGAVALFEEAATLDPTAWPALNNAGTLLLNTLGDAEKARSLFERACSLSRSPQVARNLELAEQACVDAKRKGRQR
jgi:tetratricopeptide (TPR) repeat protein